MIPAASRPRGMVCGPCCMVQHGRSRFSFPKPGDRVMKSLMLWATLAVVPFGAAAVGISNAGCPKCDCCGCCETGTCNCKDCTCACCNDGCDSAAVKTACCTSSR